MCFGSKATRSDVGHEPVNIRPVTASKTGEPTVAKMPESQSYKTSDSPQLQKYAAPPGPPTVGQQHDWESAVPDTSLLPPPPTIGYDRSDTNNASESDANRAISWCRQHGLYQPSQMPQQAMTALTNGDIDLVGAPIAGRTLTKVAPGMTVGRTKRGSPDSCITSSLPLYSVLTHSPLQTGRPKTIYFEVAFTSANKQEIDLALGFVAPPYPSFRLPGWERGSLGVHGDDGHRYVNDKWGGKDFATPFKPGETVGIGMTFASTKSDAPPAYGQQSSAVRITVEVFFTRDGEKAGGWNLHEENDAQQDLPVTGLEGLHDLYAAIGTFDAVEFEVIFDARKWKYRL